MGVQIAGIVFPVPILLMVPIRQYLYPYIFGKAFLQDLDPMPGEDDSSSLNSGAEQDDVAFPPEGPQLDVRDPEIGFDPKDPSEAAQVCFLL